MKHCLRKAFFCFLFVILPVCFNVFSSNETPPSNGKLLGLGLEQLKAGDYKNALALANLVLQNDPGNLNAYHLKTIVLWNQGQIGGVIKTLRTAEEHGVKSVVLYEIAAQAALRVGMPEMAIGLLAELDEFWVREQQRK